MISLLLTIGVNIAMSWRVNVTFCLYKLCSFSLRLVLQYRCNLKSVNRSPQSASSQMFPPCLNPFWDMVSPDMPGYIITPETKATKVTAFVISACAHVVFFFNLRTSIGGSFSCVRELNRWPSVCHWDCWLYSHPGHNPETQSWSPIQPSSSHY